MQQLSIPYIWRNYPHDQPYQGATKRQIWMVKLMRHSGTTTTGTCSTFSPENAKSIEIYTTKQWTTILLKWAQHWGSSWTICHTKVIYTICHWYRWSFPSYTLKVIIDPYPIFRATLTYILLWTHPNESLHLFLVVKQFCYIRSTVPIPLGFMSI